MKKIVAPVDFSATSATALRFATYLAEVMDVDLKVVHVFDANFSFAQAVSTGALLAEQERLEQELSDFVQRHAYPILATFQGCLATLPVISKEVIEGFPAKIIQNLSGEEDTELMILGGVGAGAGLTPTGIFGGVAQRLATESKCPVILIPPDYGYPEIKKLALAFREAEDVRRMGGIVRRLIRVLRPQVSFVHVETPDQKKELMNDESFLELALGPNFPTYEFSYHSLPRGPVVKRLLKYVKEEEVGLLVLGGKRRRFWEALFTTSSLKPLVNRCEVPLLIVPLTEDS